MGWSVTRSTAPLPVPFATSPVAFAAPVPTEPAPAPISLAAPDLPFCSCFESAVEFWSALDWPQAGKASAKLNAIGLRGLNVAIVAPPSYYETQPNGTSL